MDRIKLGKTFPKVEFLELNENSRDTESLEDGLQGKQTDQIQHSTSCMVPTGAVLETVHKLEVLNPVLQDVAVWEKDVKEELITYVGDSGRVVKEETLADEGGRVVKEETLAVEEDEGMAVETQTPTDKGDVFGGCIEEKQISTSNKGQMSIIAEKTPTYDEVAGSVVKEMQGKQADLDRGIAGHSLQEYPQDMPYQAISVCTKGFPDQLSLKACPPRANDYQGTNQNAPEDKATFENNTSKAQSRELGYTEWKPTEDETFARDEQTGKNARTKSHPDSITEEYFKSIIRLMEEQETKDQIILGVPFKSKCNLELSNPSDMQRFLINYENYLAKPLSNSDEDISCRTETRDSYLNQLNEGTNNFSQLDGSNYNVRHLNETINDADDKNDDVTESVHLNESANILKKPNKDCNKLVQVNQTDINRHCNNESKRECNELNRKVNALGCEITDISADENTVDGPVMSISSHKKTNCKKRKKESFVEHDGQTQEIESSNMKLKTLLKERILARREKKDDEHVDLPQKHIEDEGNQALTPSRQQKLENIPNFTVMESAVCKDKEEKKNTCYNKIKAKSKKSLRKRKKSNTEDEILSQIKKRMKGSLAQGEPFGNIPNFAMFGSSNLKACIEEEKTVPENIKLTFVRKHSLNKARIKDTDDDEDDDVKQRSSEWWEIKNQSDLTYGFVEGAKSDDGVDDYDDEKTLLYGFDGPFGKIII